MAEQGPRFKLSFHGPGSLAIFITALWFLLYALSTIFKASISGDVLGIVAFIAALLLFVGV